MQCAIDIVPSTIPGHRCQYMGYHGTFFLFLVPYEKIKRLSYLHLAL